VLETSGINAVVDWVLVELRTGTAASTRIATRSCLLLRGGDIVDVDGVTIPRFQVPPGEYHIVLRHRNHLGAMTQEAVELGTSPVTIDLSDPSVPLFGTNAMRTVDGVRVLWMGDVSHNGIVKYTGSDNDRDPILQQVGGSVPTATSTGYHTTDGDLDGVIKYTGANNDRDPILSVIGGAVPTAVRVEQVP
jgi:hypothetical protein